MAEWFYSEVTERFVSSADQSKVCLPDFQIQVPSWAWGSMFINPNVEFPKDGCGMSPFRLRRGCVGKAWLELVGDTRELHRKQAQEGGGTH